VRPLWFEETLAASPTPERLPGAAWRVGEPVVGVQRAGDGGSAGARGPTCRAGAARACPEPPAGMVRAPCRGAELISLREAGGFVSATCRPRTPPSRPPPGPDSSRGAETRTHRTSVTLPPPRQEALTLPLSLPHPGPGRDRNGSLTLSRICSSVRLQPELCLARWQPPPAHPVPRGAQVNWVRGDLSRPRGVGGARGGRGPAPMGGAGRWPAAGATSSRVPPDPLSQDRAKRGSIRAGSNPTNSLFYFTTND
jgi:hypothetical protein